MSTQKPDRATFLEPSTSQGDGGELIGRDPRAIPRAELRRLGLPESPIKAIRARCIDCSGGHASEVRRCIAVNCALWPFRMGVSPFHSASTSARFEQAKFATSGDGRGQ